MTAVNMPPELLFQIFVRLPSEDITKNVALVCQLWHQASKDDYLWRSVVQQTYPLCSKPLGISWFQYQHSLQMFVKHGAWALKSESEADCLYKAQDRGIHIWRISMNTGRNHTLGSPLRFWHGFAQTDHQMPICSLAIQPFKHSVMLLTGAADHTVKIWKQTMNRERDIVLKCQEELQWHNSPVISMRTFGKTIAIGSLDGSIAVWNKMQDGKYSPALLPGHTSEITDLQFDLSKSSPNRQVLFSAAKDNTLRVWAVSKGGNVESLQQFIFDNTYPCSISSELFLRKLYTLQSDFSLKKWLMDRTGTLSSKETRVINAKAFYTVPGDKSILTVDERSNIWMYHEEIEDAPFSQPDLLVACNLPIAQIFHTFTFRSYADLTIYICHQNGSVSIYQREFYSQNYELVGELQEKNNAPSLSTPSG